VETVLDGADLHGLLDGAQGFAGDTKENVELAARPPRVLESCQGCADLLDAGAILAQVQNALAISVAPTKFVKWATMSSKFCRNEDLPGQNFYIIGGQSQSQKRGFDTATSQRVHRGL
jgi:hypothetical protein